MRGVCAAGAFSPRILARGGCGDTVLRAACCHLRGGVPLNPTPYTLRATHCTLHTAVHRAPCTLRNARCALSTANYTLHTSHYTHCTLHTSRCILHAAHYILHPSYYAHHTTHYTLRTALYTLHTDKCQGHHAVMCAEG